MEPLFIMCGLCQVISTLPSVIEMAVSLSESDTATMTTNDFFPSHATALQTFSLIDDMPKLRFMRFMLTYLGVIFLFNASCVLIYVFYNRSQYRNIKAFLGPSGCFMLLQILGVCALVVRLVVLLLYTVGHVCDEGGENLEPNHIMLGIAAVFGLLSLFLYVGYVLKYMYNKCSQYEDSVKLEKRMHNIYTNKLETLVEVNLKDSVCKV